MNDTQQCLLNMAENNNLSRISLRKIASMLGEPNMSPGLLQYHFMQLEKKKLLFIDRKAKIQKLGHILDDDRFHVIPIVGMASCGPANQFADESIEGFLHITKTSLKAKGRLFALRASGDSMNNAHITTPNGNTASIENSDYVIVDVSYNSIDDNLGKYVVSIINGLANIKKLAKREYDYALISESKNMEKYSPIIIHEDDNCLINGRVITVVKV